MTASTTQETSPQLNEENFIGSGRLPTWPTGSAKFKNRILPPVFPSSIITNSSAWLSGGSLESSPANFHYPQKQIVMEKIRRKRIIGIINLLEAEDVFHVVEAGGLAAGPDGGTEGAVGESVSSWPCG